MSPEQTSLNRKLRGIKRTVWHVYILKCNDSSLYTGITTNLEERLLNHNKGKGARYTKLRRPVTLLYTEPFDSKSEALKREIEIKNFSLQNKIRLIKFGRGKRFPSAFYI